MSFKPLLPFSVKECPQCGFMRPFHRFIGEKGGINRLLTICDICQFENKTQGEEKNNKADDDK